LKTVSSLGVLAVVLGLGCAVAACDSGGSAPDHGSATPSPRTASSAADDGFFDSPVPIGVKYDQPGFSVEAHGVYSGFDIDLARFVAQKLHFAEDSFVDISSDEERPGGLGKKYKLVIATYTINSERETGEDGPAVDFIGPYLETPAGLLVKKNSKFDKPKPDLSTMHNGICVLSGSTPSKTDLHGAKVIVAPHNYSECVKDVKSGKADAMLTDELIDYGYAAVNQGLAVQPIDIQNYFYGIGIKHGDAAACEKLKPVVKEFINSPEWDGFFTEEFKQVPAQNPNWQQDYKPLVSEVDTHSYCK
jgi:glutamate transport system substrate-binding protein